MIVQKSEFFFLKSAAPNYKSIISQDFSSLKKKDRTSVMKTDDMLSTLKTDFKWFNFCLFLCISLFIIPLQQPVLVSYQHIMHQSMYIFNALIKAQKNLMWEWYLDHLNS